MIVQFMIVNFFQRKLGGWWVVIYSSWHKGLNNYKGDNFSILLDDSSVYVGDSGGVYLFIWGGRWVHRHVLTKQKVPSSPCNAVQDSVDAQNVPSSWSTWSFFPMLLILKTGDKLKPDWFSSAYRLGDLHTQTYGLFSEGADKYSLSVPRQFVSQRQLC